MPVLSITLALFVSANTHLADGERLVEALRFDEAARVLALAVEVPTSTTEERRRAFGLYARSLVALGKTAAAEEAFAALLAQDPRAGEPEDASPSVVALFLRAKRRLFPPPAVRLVERAATEGRFSIEVVDPWKLARTFELRSPSVRQALPLENDRLDGPQLPAGEVLALNEAQVVLARVGVALTSAPGSTPVVAAQKSRALGFVLLGMGALAAMFSVGLGVSASSDVLAAQQARFASDVRAHEEAAGNKALGAWIAGGVGLAVAGAGVVAFVW